MMSTDLELFINPMCPFAQRCLLVLSFKRVLARVQQVNLSDKPAWFLQVNPSGALPFLIIRTQEGETRLRESLVIAQFIDSLPGLSLYPDSGPKVLRAMRKAIIDMKIATDIDPLRRALRMVYWKSTHNDREIARFKRIVRNVNDMVTDGKFFEAKIFGTDQVGFLDLMALPFVERILAFRDETSRLYEKLDLGNLEMWYFRIGSVGFVKPHLMPSARYLNLRKIMQGKKYKGLQLPPNNYDLEPKL